MSESSITLSANGTTEERIAHEMGLRWNDGVLEQCYAVTYFDRFGVPYKLVPVWRPVPQAQP